MLVPDFMNGRSFGAVPANLNLKDQPVFTETESTVRALKEIMLAISEEDRPKYKGDENAMKEAMRSFRHQRLVKPDGKDSWFIKGMKSSLLSHQLLGTAFMRRREKGT